MMEKLLTVSSSTWTTSAPLHTERKCTHGGGFFSFFFFNESFLLLLVAAVVCAHPWRCCCSALHQGRVCHNPLRILVVFLTAVLFLINPKTCVQNETVLLHFFRPDRKTSLVWEANLINPDKSTFLFTFQPHSTSIFIFKSILTTYRHH